ncbi:MAG: GntR family transcriptional regulator [Victivallaceae bacterium]|nr:GntR family transcriptional regulator [Victivallaceae bacterium]
MQSLFDSKATIVAEDIRSKISNGDFLQVDKLPSTSKLASRYSVSRETVNIAMAQLVRDGLIYRKRGFGSVITKNNPDKLVKPHLGIYLPMLQDENSSLSPSESPTWSLIFYGVLHACAERGYTLIPIPNKGYSWEKIISDYKLGGILLPGGQLKIMESFWISGMQKQVKYFMMDRAMNFTEANYVEEFSPVEICRAVNMLLDKGHRRIAAVGTDTDAGKTVFQNFFDGYRTAMREKKLYSPSYVKRVFEHTQQEYDQLIVELMDRAEPPTLILAFNYLYIEGLIDALERRGLQVPQDISVVMTNFEKAKYKGKEISGFIGPGKHLLGEIAANSLIDLMENKTKEPLEINIELKFYQGDTLRCC